MKKLQKRKVKDKSSISCKRWLNAFQDLTNKGTLFIFALKLLFTSIPLYGLLSGLKMTLSTLELSKLTLLVQNQQKKH